jgi:hypothetical protein
MTGFLRRGRPAALVGAGMAILIAGAAAGAAGDPVIAGANNSSGASQTILQTTAFGASFTLKNTTNGQTGQFGWSSGTAGAGRGLYGRADSPDGFGVDAYNSGTVSGSGAALRARSDKNDAIVATSSGCQTGFICGSFGVHGTGYGFGAGVFGDGTGSLAGVEASADTIWAFYGTSDVADFPAALINNTAGIGVQAEGIGASDTSDACSFLYCFGAVGTGENGVGGWTATDGGYALYGDASGAAGGYALAGIGDGFVSGDFFIGGACTGCTAAVIAQNGSSKAIAQGQAVTIKGVTTGADGKVVVVVDLAKGNDQVFGIADVAMAPAKDTVSAGKSTVTHKTKFGDVTRTSQARTLKNQAAGKLIAAGTSAKTGAFLRVITGGVYAFKAAAPSAAAGDSLAVGTTAGKLDKASANVAKGATAGKFLGSLKDGRIVLLVAPS